MFGIKKKTEVRKIHLDRAMDEVSNLKRGESIIIYKPRGDMLSETFKRQVESVAFRRSLMMLSEPETDDNGNFYVRLQKI